MKTKAEILAALKQCRILLAGQDAWCQGELAKNKVGVEVDSTDPDACQWCAIGAICKVTGWENHGLESDCGALFKAMQHELLVDINMGNSKLLTDHWSNIPSFNDAKGRKQEDILAMYDTTITRLEAQ